MSAAHFRLLFECAPAPMCSATEDGTVQFVNRAAAELLRADVVGRHAQDVLPSGWSCTPLDDEQGQLWTYTSSHLQRQIEVEQAKLQAVFEQAPLPMALLVGPQHRFEFVSQPYAEYILGGREYAGRPAAELLPEALEQGFIDLLDSVRSRGERYVGSETAFVLHQQDGTAREFFFNFVYEPMRDEHGHVEGILAVISDVTEQVRAREVQVEARRQVEAAARELETERLKLATMVEANPSGIALMRGPDFVFEKVNSQWCSFVSPRDYIGRPYADVYPELLATDLPARLRHTFATGEPFSQPELRLRVEVLPGVFEEQYYEVNFLRIVDPTGQPYGILGHGANVTERVRAATALQASQSDLVDTLESMSDAFFSVDAQWRIQRVNARMEQVTGISRDALIGEDLLRLFLYLPEHRETKYWSGYHEAMERRVSVRFEEHYGPLDLWTEVRVYPKADGGLAVFVADVGDRVRAEAELALERHKLETIFQESPAAMALWTGPDLVFERVNPAYQAIFGERPLVGLPLLEAIPELVGQPFPDLLQGVLETGLPAVGKETAANLVSPRSGLVEEQYFDFSYLPLRYPGGKPYGVYNHSVNVTERVRARKRLEQSEARLRRNQEQLARAVFVSKIGFFDWDIPGDQIHFSDQMRSDWTIADGVGLQQALERIHPEDRADAQKRIRHCLLTGALFSAEYRVVRTDGRVIWVEAQGEVFHNEVGRAVRFFGTALDITERKARQQELEAAKLAAERANETKSSFLANMSHEIRTPLGSILGFTELLRQSELDAAEQRQFLDIISRNGKALTRIIDDILDLAKVESGKLLIEQVEVAFPRLAEEVLELFREKAREKNIALQLEVPPGVPERFLSDPTRLRQILINIVGNAVKFTDRGGVRVLVSCERTRKGDWWVRVVVRDTGVGIPADQRGKLFQPFVQADNTSTRKYGGTGLGLVLSNRLAQALGGEVRLEEFDRAEPGSTFVIYFAAGAVADQPDQVVPSEESAADAAPPLHGLHILLADDSPDNRLFLHRILASHGAEVATAENGEVLCRMATNGRYDVVLVDLQMPVVDGYEATRRLRAGGYTGPIIALTAHAMAEERARTRAAGCDGHLTKPVNQPELLATIRAFARGDNHPGP